MNFSELSPIDAAVPSSGNRFDVPGGAVLYAATTAEGAFAETLGRLRPTARMQALPVESDENLMTIGSVPADWRERRQLVELSVDDPLPFLDVDSPDSHTYLTAELAAQLVALGIDCIDVSEVRGKNRILTRAIAEWAFAAVDSSGDLRYGGIRYASKLGNWECWAIFGGSEIRLHRMNAIEKHDARLQRVARQFGLTIH